MRTRCLHYSVRNCTCECVINFMLRIIRDINEEFVIASLYDKANDGDASVTNAWPSANNKLETHI